MNERLPRRTSLDLSQPNEVAALEVAIAMLEFP
jgi:hypothetical protein